MLLIALAVIYLSFGIVAGGALGLLGVGGAVAVLTAVAVHQRARLGATALMVFGALPFAIGVWWTVIMPVTALLILAIGVPRMITAGISDAFTARPGTNAPSRRPRDAGRE